MTVEDHPGLSPAQTPPPEHNHTNGDNFSQTESLPLAKNAFRAALLYFIAASIAFLGEIYLAFQIRAWQVYALVGVGGVIALLTALSLYLTRRSRPRYGVRLLIGASLISVLIAPFLVRGFGLILGMGVILVILTIALQTLRQKEANWVVLISVGVAVVAGGIDLLAPATQLALPQFGTLILVLGGLLLLASGGLMINQFSAYPLTIKLILAFFAVSLIPLGLLVAWNDYNTRKFLLEDAQQSLLSAAVSTAAGIDAFINNNLDSLRTEAQLPVLVTFLNLPADQRPNSAEAHAVIATLLELSRKDKVFIDSYALLDIQGQNLADTYAPNIGQDESGRSYFTKPLETGLPYSSPLEFGSFFQASASTEQSGLYFSGPVRDPGTGQIIGVLRARYKSNILQQIVVQNNNLVGRESFAILFDENYFRLAHGADPKLVFVSARSLTPAQIDRLKANHRLPNRATSAGYSSDLPDLVQGLDNAIFEPNFSTRLLTSENKVHLAVVAELESHPWVVLFAQPEEVFLAPIQSQTRSALFLAIAIAGAVTLAAFVMGHFLAEPLVHLTGVVTQFTAGNLQARATIKSGDESGILAANFNAMAAQVGNLLNSLAERKSQLESEILERQRAEADLQASEEKYRRLFEDSRDVIFITAINGHVIDVNPQAEILFGHSCETLKQMNALDLYVDPNQRQRFQEMIQQQGSVRDFEVQIRREDGAIRDCLITAATWQDDNGHVLGYQGNIRDITAQKQIEKEQLRFLAIEQELTLAQEIQQSLLPPAQPNWHNPEVICYSTPAREMGGDLFAYHAFNNGRYAITVGDVSGKGMPAALLMAVSISSFQAVVGQGLQPGALLAHLDRAIAPYTRDTDQNCALVYAEISWNGHRQATLRVANAGCMTPLIRRADSSISWVDAVGIPLGMHLGAELGYPEVEVSLSSGDFVILTSDGVVEAMNRQGNLFGFERLEQAVATGPVDSAQAMLDHLKQEVQRFVGPTEPHDDLTIVVAKV